MKDEHKYLVDILKFGLTKASLRLLEKPYYSMDVGDGAIVTRRQFGRHR